MIIRTQKSAYWLLNAILFAFCTFALSHTAMAQTNRIGDADQLKIATPSFAKTLNISRTLQQEDEITDPVPEMVQDTLPNIEATLWDGSNLTKPIMDIPLNIIDVAKRRPPDSSEAQLDLDYRSNYPGNFQPRWAMWCAPNIRYNPLYFESVGLERYGYDCGDVVQPAFSALHFGVSLAALPFNLFRQPPWSCSYPLGYCRPGSYAPQTRNVWIFWK
ncbi:MAG: hypothetical protein P8J33_11145 [Pirellulaceae bacterium]|nr:hypothetical protein [Pirellulaceae bacterium]